MKLYRRFGAVLLLAAFLQYPFTTGAQTLALRTNLVYGALLVPSVGADYALSDRHSISLQGTYIPYAVGSRKWKNWSVQPELRIWREAPFCGPFLGINVIGGGFNINHVHVGGLDGLQRQGYMMGAGLTAGCHRVLSARWNLELTLGADVLLCTYERLRDGELIDHRRSTAVLPIGTGVSLVYIID